MSVSLEDQRRALLEQIEASRAVYRRMLSGESATVSVRHAGSPRLVSSTRPASSGAGMFAGVRWSENRSKAVQWAMAHPLWVAGGVALLVWALPRMKTARRQKKQRAERRIEREQEVLLRSPGIVRALLAAALLLMRDPGRMQAAGRLARMGWQWLQRRRASAPALAQALGQSQTKASVRQSSAQQSSVQEVAPGAVPWPATTGLDANARPARSRSTLR